MDPVFCTYTRKKFIGGVGLQLTENHEPSYHNNLQVIGCVAGSILTSSNHLTVPLNSISFDDSL